MKVFRLIQILLFISLILFFSCGKEDPCEIINVSNSGSITTNCEGGSISIYNVQYDGVFGELLSYNFKATCGNGKVYSGSVQITWSGHIAVSSSYTVNGKRCR